VEIDSNDWKNLGKSLLWGVPVFILGITWIGYFGYGLFVLLVGVAIVATGLAGIFASPFSALLFPSRRGASPRPMYSRASAREKNGKYEEAILLYEEILAGNPEEVKPYIEMIRIAIERLDDPSRADNIFRKATSRIRRHEDRDYLERMYRALRKS
jgi:tetratricopeptide (TPR) repeat protein